MKCPMRFVLPWLHGLWVLVAGLMLGVQLATFLFAPSFFHAAQQGLLTSQLAGTLAGKCFESANLFTLIALPLLLLVLSAGGKRGANRTIVGLLAVALVLQLIESVGIAPAIAGLREEIAREVGAVANLPEDDPRRGRFGMLHGLSVLRGGVQWLVGAAALLVYTRSLSGNTNP